MDTKGYLELLFNDSANSYYFAEVDTYNLLFVNKVMEKKLRTYEDFTQKKCYEMIHNRTTPCNFCPMAKIKDSEFLEQRIFNEVTRSYHRANSTLMTINATKICACKYFVAFVDESAMKISYNKAISKCIDILNNKKAGEAIKEFLPLLGQYHQCEQTFIYELDLENKAITSKFTWSREKDAEDIDYNEDKRFIEDFMVWLIATSTEEYIEVNGADDYAETDFETKLLSMNHAKNFVIYPLKNRMGKIMGYVGLTNRPTKTEFDSRLVQTVARYVQESYSKNVLVNEMKAVNYLDDQTGFFNRKRYMECVRDMEETPPHSLGVLFVSLGDLRRINEKEGFAAGNAMIENSADFLRKYFQEPFYRITGDEFICFVIDSSEGDFYERLKSLEEGLSKENAPDLQVGCAWDSLQINVQKLVSEADRDMNKH